MRIEPHSERLGPAADLTSAIVQSSLDAVIVMDHHGNVVEFNPAAERTFGYRRQDALGRPLAALVTPPLLRAQHRAGLERYLEGGDAPVIGRQLELIAMRADGSELPIAMAVTAVRAANGPPLFVGIIRDLTDRKRTEHELRRTTHLFDLVLDHSQDLISLVDPTGRIDYVSPSHERVMGFGEEELVGANFLDFVHPDDVTMVAEQMATAGSEAAGFMSEIRIRHKDGHWVSVEGVGRLIIRDGEPPIVLISARDVSERKSTQEALLHMAAIVESTDDAIVSKSVDGQILSWNSGAERLYGYTAAEAVGRSVSILIPPDRPGELRRLLDRVRRGERIQHFETERVRKDGSRFEVSLSVSPIRDARGQVIGSSAIARDITDRKRAQEQIAYLAYHDSLTGLPNRARFEDLLNMGLARARRHGLSLAVLYLDLDDFKLVNDGLGHAAGDDLLQKVAHRLLAASRETDGVARLGGDEFMMLVPDLPRRKATASPRSPDPAVAAAKLVVARIQEALKEPFRLGESVISVSASIGIAVFPLDADDAGTLFRHADVAMYQSKRSGQGRSRVFTPRRPRTERRSPDPSDPVIGHPPSAAAPVARSAGRSRRPAST